MRHDLKQVGDELRELLTRDPHAYKCWQYAQRDPSMSERDFLLLLVRTLGRVKQEYLERLVRQAECAPVIVTLEPQP